MEDSKFKFMTPYIWATLALGLFVLGIAAFVKLL